MHLLLSKKDTWRTGCRFIIINLIVYKFAGRILFLFLLFNFDFLLQFHENVVHLIFYILAIVVDIVELLQIHINLLLIHFDLLILFDNILKHIGANLCVFKQFGRWRKQARRLSIHDI